LITGYGIDPAERVVTGSVTANGKGFVELQHIILAHSISSLCSSVIQVHWCSPCSNISSLLTGMSRFFCVGKHHCRRSRKFWKDIHHLTVTVSLLAQKSPRQSLIPPFQDSWYPTTIAILGICSNETAPPMHRRFGLHPPLSCQHFLQMNAKLTFP
jgi:hypothetical protein